MHIFAQWVITFLFYKLLLFVEPVNITLHVDYHFFISYYLTSSFPCTVAENIELTMYFLSFGIILRLEFERVFILPVF